jgi:uncharacterized protein YhaN
VTTPTTRTTTPTTAEEREVYRKYLVAQGCSSESGDPFIDRLFRLLDDADAASALAESVARLTAAHESAVAEVARLTKEIERVTRERIATNARERAERHGRETLSDEIDRLHAEIERLGEYVDLYSQARYALDTERASLASLRSALAAETERRERAERERDEARVEVANVGESLDGAIDAGREDYEEIAALRAACTEKDAEIGRLTHRLAPDGQTGAERAAKLWEERASAAEGEAARLAAALRAFIETLDGLADPPCASVCDHLDCAQVLRAALSGGTASLDAALARADATGYARGVEDAAKACESWASSDGWGKGETLRQVALSIRALAAKETP